MKRSLLAIAASLLLVACQRADLEPGERVGASVTSIPPTVTATASPAATPSVASSPVAAPVQADPFMRGVNVLLYGNASTFPERYGQLLDRLVADHVTSVSLVVPLYQASWTASNVTTFEETPPDDRVRLAVRLAHSRGLSVMLRPSIDERGINQTKDKWRGVIEPAVRTAWHDSYRTRLLHYASLAADEHVELLCIGVELVSMTQQQDLPAWQRLIDAVKAVYSGKLTYSQNHNAVQMDTGFWGRMDYVGIDAFYELDAPATPTAADMQKAWAAPALEVEALRKRFGLPILFTEVGTTSERGSFKQPWVWNWGTGVDLASQALYYAAACEVATRTTTGIYFWGVIPDPIANPTSDPSFDFRDKPAERAMSDCYGRTGLGASSR